MDAFMGWWEAAKPDVHASEMKTYHKILLYAGTVDLYASINGVKTLIDFKTTSKLIESNCRVQLEAYAQALESHGLKVERKAIVHLSKDGRWKEHSFQINDAEAWSVFGSLKNVYEYINAYMK